jgi:hypothetical protein
VYLRLKNEEYEHKLLLDVDIRKWLPGDSVEYFDIPLPEDMPKGKYEISISIGEGTLEKPCIQLAMQTKKEGEFYYLMELEVE